MTPKQLFLVAVLVALGFASLFVGAAGIEGSEVWAGLLSRLGLGTSSSLAESIVWDIRIPRALGAILVGFALGSAGTGLQGVFRVPLAEPYLLGLSSAAGFGFLLGSFLTSSGSGYLLGVLFAVSATVLATLVIRRVATVVPDGNSFLLSGVAIGFALLAWTLVLLFAADSPRLPTFTYFVFGGLGTVTWELLAVALPVGVIAIVLMSLRSGDLDIIALGRVEADSLGVDTPRVSLTVLTGASAAVGAAVSAAGVVGFIGLLAPMLGRRWVGVHHTPLLWASATLGASLVLVADIAIRGFGGTVEVPLGVVTAAIGGPVFVGMLLKGRHG